MQEFLDAAGDDLEESSWRPFDKWMDVVGKEAEIMAGQHRVLALKAFLRQISNQTSAGSIEKEESWWICEVYDIGKVDCRGKDTIALIDQSDFHLSLGVHFVPIVLIQP